MHKQELKDIVQSIIASGTVGEHIEWAKNLSKFYKKITGTSHSLTNETLVSGGFALSSSGAADCVDDYLRTIYFLKGIYKALTKISADFPERSINILYAGCGPYATLILPLLPLFDKGRINAVLLDINASSIASVHNLISVIGFEDYQLRLIEADATSYAAPENFIIDLAISETMHYGLTREPQVAIVKNIAPQLPEHGIFIPQEISIDLAYTFFDYEPYLKNALNEIKGHTEMQPYSHRVFIDRLFTINKELFNVKSDSHILKSKYFNFPTNFQDYPDLCVFTELKIFDDIELKTAESYITNPYCIVSLYSLTGASEIQLEYDFRDIPKWSYNVRTSCN